MTNYLILEADSARLLEKIVNDYLQNGWVLCGGVSVSIASSGGGTERSFVQAVGKVQR